MPLFFLRGITTTFQQFESLNNQGHKLQQQNESSAVEMRSRRCNFSAVVLQWTKHCGTSNPRFRIKI